MVMLPYTEGVSEDIRQVCRKFSMKVVFRSGQSLRSMLTKVNNALTMEKLSKVVHWVPCSCSKAYIGETVRRLETRMKEHRDACRKGALEKSALAEHAWESHHLIKWEEAIVVDQARSPKELLLKEAIHIQLLNPPSPPQQGWGTGAAWMLIGCPEGKQGDPPLPVTCFDNFQ